jgi:hypothetical protein
MEGMAMDRIEQLQAEAAALREALEKVEWIASLLGNAYCPWCHTVAYDVRKHHDDCPRQAALAADAGRAMLEQVRALEKESENELRGLD